MNQTMLRQLLWVCIIGFTTVSASYAIIPDLDQCDRPECIPVDKIFEANVAYDLEPCDDFLKYACGRNFTSDAAVAIGMHGYQAPSDIEGLRSILDSGIPSSPPRSLLDFERLIYKKCKEEGTHTERELRLYEKFVATMTQNRLAPTRDYQSHVDEWLKTDFNYANKGYGFAFFDIDIVERRTSDYADLRRYIQISPTSDNVFHINDLLTTRYMNPNAGSKHKSQHAAEKYEKIKSFIGDLNKILPYDKSDEYSRDDTFAETRTVSDWNRRYYERAYLMKNKIDWKTLLKELFDLIQQDIDKDERIIIKDEDYFFRLASKLQSYDVNVIVDYIHLRFVAKTIGLADINYKERYSIIPHIEGLSCTPGMLLATAHEFTQKYFPLDNKQTLDGIVSSIKGSIETQLGLKAYNPQATNDATKVFLNDLKNADIITGYPDWISNSTIISHFFGGTWDTMDDTYFSNQLKTLYILMTNKLKSYRDYGRPIIDMKAFYKSFTEEDIYISKNFKQIVIPARAFSENTYVFLSGQLYDPINYGAAGTAIASELYLRYLRKIAYNENATQCIKDQMPRQLGFRGPEYLLQATAYLLGMRTAYDSWPSKDSHPIVFPTYGAATDFVVFFLSFAQSMCRARPRDDIPPYVFLNFIVSNSEEFTDAYQCYPSHQLNRRNKCKPV